MKIITKLKNKILNIKNKYFPDRKYRVSRIWSNEILSKIAPIFYGDIINVSAWQDYDKVDRFYKDYFFNASTYSISNYSGERGYQKSKNEIFIDLEKDLDKDYINKFDVVYNHTTLEHIFNVNKAFNNLCLMSKDIVILVVPFLQEVHCNNSFSDYWRFTPFSIKKMFELNNMELIFWDANDNRNESIYIFAVGSKNTPKWSGRIPIKGKSDMLIGKNIIGSF